MEKNELNHVPGFLILVIALFEELVGSTIWPGHGFWVMVEFVILAVAAAILGTTARGGFNKFIKIFWLATVGFLLFAQQSFYAGKMMEVFVCFAVAEFVSEGRKTEDYRDWVMAGIVAAVYLVQWLMSWFVGVELFTGAISLLLLGAVATFPVLMKDCNRNIVMQIMLFMFFFPCIQPGWGWIMPYLLGWWFTINIGLKANELLEGIKLPKI